jgi:hypothetical protein
MRGKPQAKVITIAAFYDRRDIANLYTIGLRIKHNGITIPFTYWGERPEVMIAQAVRLTLFHQGYQVWPGTPQWDLNPQTVQEAWGEWVVGGAIEDLSIEAKSSILRTIYTCTFKLRVAAANGRQKESILQQTVELSSSYTTAVFRSSTAERMFNKIIAQAIESSVADIEKTQTQPYRGRTSEGIGPLNQ